MTNSTDTIKDRLSIVDVVGSYITLTPRGNSYVARCPFHNEKTPSFYVTPDRGTYHCFGCGKGGDIFSFVQDFEGLDFKQALQNLAAKAGIELEQYSGVNNKESKDETERLYKLIAEVVTIYESDLENSLKIEPDVNKYLQERGLNNQTLKTFNIGYAKNEWRYLTTTLKQRGYTDNELVLAGLSVATTKGLYDKFRGRIMFPIANSQGKFVGFSGRIMPKYSVHENGNEAPKYMNSPETPLYHKSNVLFGYSVARDAIRKNSRVVVVEGMMDVLMSHQAGVYETIAVSGTALTTEHAKILRRLAEKVYLCFDADEAGVNAMFRILPMLIEMDIDVYVISVPEGKKDPADIVFESDRLWIDLVNNAKSLIDFLVDYAKLKHSNLKDLRNFADTQIVPIIARINKVMNRAHAVNVLSRAIDLPEETLYAALLEKDKNKIHIKEPETAVQKSPPADQIFIGMFKLNNLEYAGIIKKIFDEYLEVEPGVIIDEIETDGHTLESYAQKGLDDAEDKLKYIEELALGFIKKHIENKLKISKANEGDLEIITNYTKKLDLINRQHHTNNYE